ncbi:hypothetical protein STRDD11_00109 [Streptococcus sp. DD11]|nr:hypothetical protein STRDD11_00109 [Streptococcus sp. DD11]
MIAAGKDFFTGQNTEVLQSLVNAVLTVAAGRVLGHLFDRAGPIPHSNGQADTGQHFQIIVRVSESHDLADIKAVFPADPANPLQFRHVLVDNIHCIGAAAGKFQIRKLPFNLMAFFRTGQNQGLINGFLNQLQELFFMLGQGFADNFVKTVTDGAGHFLGNELAGPLGERTHAKGHNLGPQHGICCPQRNLFSVFLGISNQVPQTLLVNGAGGNHPVL